MSMREIPFSDLRGKVQIGEGFADDNILVTDAGLGRLPKLAFTRHHGSTEEITGCRFEIPATASGNLRFYIARSGSSAVFGPKTRANLDIQFWRPATLTVGQNTTFNKTMIICDDSDVEVGPDCMFSSEITLQSNDQHGLIDMVTGAFTNDTRRKVVVGEHVWVGRGAMIMPDTEIGSGSVIGARSLAAGTLCAFGYHVGTPARTVRERASWTRSPGRISPVEKAFFDRHSALFDTTG